MENGFEDEEMGFEVIVSRIKLRLRKNPNGTTGKFNFQYRRKHLVDDSQFDHIIEEIDFPKRVYSASKYTPSLPFRSTRMTILSALSKFDNDDYLDPESRQLITRHVLAFDRHCRHQRNNPSSVSIDVDINVVTGSYNLIGRQEEDMEYDWDYFKDGHWNMTHPWIVDDDDDKDYHVVKYLDNMSSYALVPCGGGRRGDLKAVSFTTDEVTRACTCAICLVDFEPDHRKAMMNVLKMPCGHVFHRHCIVSWILSNSEEPAATTCPLCRATMHFL